MKWFKHDTDASDDIKLRRLEEEYGNDGYAVFFKTLEIIGKEGEKCRLNLEKYPKKWLSSRCHISEEKLTEILTFMGKVSLCCSKSLKNNSLYVSNFRKRADDYTKRLRRKYGVSSDNVPLEENRTDKKRKEENKGILTHFQNLYKEDLKVPYPITYGKDQKLIYELMEIYPDPKDIKFLIDTFFEMARNPKCWWADKISIGVFKQVLPQVIGKVGR